MIETYVRWEVVVLAGGFLITAAPPMAQLIWLAGIVYALAIGPITC